MQIYLTDQFIWQLFLITAWSCYVYIDIILIRNMRHMKLFSVNFELFKVLNEISVISQIKGERFIKTYPKCEIGPVRLKQRGSPVRFFHRFVLLQGTLLSYISCVLPHGLFKNVSLSPLNKLSSIAFHFGITQYSR